MLIESCGTIQCKYYKLGPGRIRLGMGWNKLGTGRNETGLEHAWNTLGTHFVQVWKVLSAVVIVVFIGSLAASCGYYSMLTLMLRDRFKPVPSLFQAFTKFKHVSSMVKACSNHVPSLFHTRRSSKHVPSLFQACSQLTYLFEACSKQVPSLVASMFPTLQARSKLVRTMRCARKRSR